MLESATTVGVNAQEERKFYDDYYRRFLELPEHAMRCDREVMFSGLENPADGNYERRRLFRAGLEQLLAEPLAGRKVLDYGCGTGNWGVLLATEGAEVALLDLSPVAIEVGLRRARVHGVAERVRGYARDASDLGCFADGEFDLIHAGGSVHHTMKYPNALEELVRVLKPGGKLVLVDTYGNNPLLNLARWVRQRLSREPKEAGEGIILSDREINRLRPHLSRIEFYPMNLLAMAKRLFRGRFESPLVRGVMAVLEKTDAVLLTLFPF
ncbi:MAG: class I SAM-dependent methyltransferase, partial [Candidatus Acidiferrales bacterium]